MCSLAANPVCCAGREPQLKRCRKYAEPQRLASKRPGVLQAYCTRCNPGITAGFAKNELSNLRSSIESELDVSAFARVSAAWTVRKDFVVVDAFVYVEDRCHLAQGAYAELIGSALIV
jgi:hypothetical protein